ncbi:beta-aspartyl-peptidase [Anaerosolibacter sp.]|uniref:beta-aspartyl-peptidase n=1 Tax=Anaerosolibacter sp. TaxID=1872527 RepID=UPI0039F0C65B
MFKLIKNGKIYSPEYLGEGDIFIVNGKIAKIDRDVDITLSNLNIEIIDAGGKYVVPGFIDNHVHMIGGGGEGGFYSRTPEIMLSGVIRTGITTLVGVLGTDGTTRHLESLLAKARGLETEGVSTYIYTGSYEIPTITMTGSIRKDIILIDKVIGTGEVAISDHRSSEPTKEELIRLVTDTRLGGMISGKLGVVNLHMGSGKKGLDMIFEILKDTEIPIRHFFPTHVGRKRELLDQSIEFAKMGGKIDMTAGVDPNNGFVGSIKTSKAIIECMDKGVPIENITISSDGNGSMAVYNEKGMVEKLLITTLEGLHMEFKDLVKVEGVDMSLALKPITSNVAATLGLYNEKGRIMIGYDADITILDSDLEIDTVLARGKVMMKEKVLTVKGTFE